MSKGEFFKRFIFITIGAILMGVALEKFLVPYNIIDGGIAGISIMVSHLTSLPLSILLFVLNIPFLIIGYKQLGKGFAFSTLYGIAIMSLTTAMLHHSTPFPDDKLLAVLFGGMVLGMGVGLVIRYGGCLDGVEVISILISKKLKISVGNIIMVFNVVIFVIAGFVFEWSSAMYSMVTYYIAIKVIDIVVEGLNESKSVMIISNKYEEISQLIVDRLGRTTTLLHASGGYSGQDTKVIYCVVSRIELSKLKSIVQAADSQAFMAVESVADVVGGSFKETAH
ncbi:MAG: YitT family protein [Candidatus Pristimantibacillus lignocellulolyticus]|uniref:YitT family protein n=1 Tax=Candidatus Pristimantibacillus lignocellulolyticus TaxID=2994561 RepID=A0A9J6Z9Q9_9BACL|nr:MAG: YitT family protein [Candidatus Pristimantibacillus lignocellulolyticus]